MAKQEIWAGGRLKSVRCATPMKRLGIAVTARDSPHETLDFLLRVDECLVSQKEPLDAEVVIVDDASLTPFGCFLRLNNPKLRSRTKITVIRNDYQAGVVFSRLLALHSLPRGVDFFAVIDGDNEEDPDDLFKFVDYLRTHESVGAVVSTNSFPQRNFVSRLTSKIAWLVVKIVAGQSFVRNQATLRVFRGRYLAQLETAFLEEGSLAVAQTRLPITANFVKIEKKFKGASSFNKMKRAALFIEMFLGSKSLSKKIAIASASSVSVTFSLIGVLILFSENLTGHAIVWPLVLVATVVVFALSVAVFLLTRLGGREISHRRDRLNEAIRVQRRETFE